MKNGPSPLALFISYSHQDDSLRAKLDAHLATLKRTGVFDVWHDRKIGAGREWEGEIDDALERADVVLLLVSADFLASDYCHDKEMTRAMQRHERGLARVVPVIARACDWEASAFGKLQALPRDGRPIEGHPDGADSALKQVAVALRAIANELRGAGQMDHTTTAPGTPSASAKPTAALADIALEHSAPPEQRKLKIGSIKLGPLELGPFEVNWPPAGVGWARVTLAAFALTALAAFASYWFMVKPSYDAGRDFMRRGEYANAVKELEAIHAVLRVLPNVASILAQARFGAKLAEGKAMRELAPELDKLRSRDPEAPDVLVFEGLNDYWVDQDTQKAIGHFTQAAKNDPAHVDAHFLAAARYTEQAFAALEQGQMAQAQKHVSEAHNLIDQALARSPFAGNLPRYANQRAELLELEGDIEGAYAAYAQLAPTHTLSAIQSALVSWRLPNPGMRIRDALEAALTALARLENETDDAKGWSFRISSTDKLAVHGKLDKACLSDWVVQISETLQGEAEGTADSQRIPRTPQRCAHTSLVRSLRDLLCVEVLSAQHALPASDARTIVLEDWRSVRLQCDSNLKPLLPLPAETKATSNMIDWDHKRKSI